MAFDGSGNLYVANLDANTIEKFSPTGRDLGAFATGLDGPVGLAFDSSGNLYAANYHDTNGTIEKFSSTGTDLGVFASTGSQLTAGLAFDSSGNLYAADGLTNKIEEFSSTGADLGTFATTGLGEPQFLVFAPEPTSFVPAFLGFVGLIAWRLRLRRRSGLSFDPTSFESDTSPFAICDKT